MEYDGKVFWNSYAARKTTMGEVGGGYLIALGDSWFSYPLYGGSLINRIADLMGGSQSIRVEATPGAEIGDFVHGKLRHKARQLLQFDAPKASGILLSGGGNEFAGSSDLLPLLHPDCSGAKSAAECFRPGKPDDKGTVPWLMSLTLENYSTLLTRAFARLPKGAKAVLHTYDYAFPTGKGLIGKGWVLPSLKAANVPEHLHRECIRYLIDEFAEILESLQRRWPDRVVIVDSRGTLESVDEWANELHPTPEGFKKIAEKCWRPVLKAEGLVVV